MVAVPELPADPAHYVRCLAEAGYFEAVAFTAEDRQRGEQYAANAARETCAQSSQSHGRLPRAGSRCRSSSARSHPSTSRASPS